MWDRPLPYRHCGGAGTGQSWVWTEPGSLANHLVSSDQAASVGLDLVSESSPICCTILLVSAGHSHDNSLDTTLSSNAAFNGHTLRDSGSVPYYRTSEEKLSTSPGPSASLRVAKRAQARGPGQVHSHSKDQTPAAARARPPAPAGQ